MITISGTLSGLSNDISTHTVNNVTEYTGTWLSFRTTNADTYFTVNTNDFQQYSVAMELYDFGREALDDYAWPIYEFSLDSANFLYHEKFEPFKDELELGKAVHLELGSDGLLSAKIIGIELDFGDISNFKLIFSNRYRLKNGMESWIDEIKGVSRSKRSFDASKYLYNRTADKATDVDAFMKSQLEAAANRIVGASNQSVIIDGSGINVGGDSKYQIRIVDNMIAMTDDGWKTAKLAIGLFSSVETGTQWGINAEMIAGHLIIGNTLVLQNPLVDSNGNPTGIMMFQIDATGAWMYNSRIVLQDESTGGLIIIDPKYGIVAGNKLLFNTNGTTVTPEFMDKAGSITFDSEGMPQNANFYLDVKTGNAYFRGKLVAKSGKIGGFTIEDSYLHTGSSSSYVALNGSTSGSNYAYAIWAGATDPSSAPFWVKKNGEVHMGNCTINGTGTFNGNGKFTGTVQAARFLDSYGNDMMSGGKFKSDYLNLKGITITDNTGRTSFQVTRDGAVTIGGTVTGQITMGAGSSINWANVSNYNNTYNPAYNKAVDAQSAANTAKNAASTAQTAANNAQSRADAAYTRAVNAARDAENASDLAEKIANGTFYGGTFIDGKSIYSPYIYANTLSILPRYQSDSGIFSLYAGSPSSPSEMLRISYDRINSMVTFSSPRSAELNIAFGAIFSTGNINLMGTTSFSGGTVDFTRATVRGLNTSSTATFG